jgi:DNA helicase-2/ATP-dependent DNA helicase PcrA
MSRINAVTFDAFADLNAEQRAAVDHGADPLLIIAGAGSGKTKTLSARVARLIRDGAAPERVLLLTFSRRAAADMIKRVGAALRAASGASQDIAIPWAGTFHAIGARVLRDMAAHIGLSEDFTIHDRSDSADLMAVVRHEQGLDQTAKRFPMKGTCLSIYSRCVNAEENLQDVLLRRFPWCGEWEAELKTLFAAYVEAKQKQSVLDYDDLLLYWADMMDEPVLASALRERFDHVLVDEYQDTNRLQARILTGLKPDGQGVTVVGDDAQAIYGFRAAEVRNILDFPKTFSRPARVVTLEQNYRSTASILEASNAVIDFASERFTKNLRTTRGAGDKPKLVLVRDEADQARYVAERVLAGREEGVDLKAQAVLFRASDASAQLELELVRRDIPFVKFGGLKFLESSHVKDLLGVMRWMQNPRDRVAGFRTLQLLPGLGPAKATKILDAADAGGLDWALRSAPAPEAAGDLWPQFVDLALGSAAWPAAIERVVAWYDPILKNQYDDHEPRAADLAQLARIAVGFPSRERFLTDLTLDPPDATSDESAPPHRDDDFLILSTIHSAKGQEWKRVFVLNVVDGCIPSDLGVGSHQDIEEERRLLYVAMTRARDQLDLVVPQRFYVQQQQRSGDRNVFAIRSRFIPPTILSQFEETTWPVGAAANGPALTPTAKVDLAQRARSRWSY